MKTSKIGKTRVARPYRVQCSECGEEVALTAAQYEDEGTRCPFCTCAGTLFDS